MDLPDISKEVNFIQAKHYPKPRHDRCSKGHPLVEMYNELMNAYTWDCPICKRKERETEIHNQKIIDSITKPYSAAELQEMAEQEGWDN